MQSRLALFVLAALISLPALAVYKKGDTVANLCWKNHEDKTVCLDDDKGYVHVLLYNAGWCGPCNTEFSELVPLVKEFDKKAVKFISVSAEGYTRGAKPDKTFLTSWKKKYTIPFQVTGSSRDFGKEFFAPPQFIPSVVIIDGKGKLQYAEVNPGADKIVEEVRTYFP